MTGWSRALRRPDPWPALLLIVVVLTSAIIVTMVAVVVWLGLRVGNPGEPEAAFSLANYPEIFGDPFIYRILGNTVAFSLVTLVVSLLFGIPLAWLVERTDLAGKSILFTLMTVGLLLPGFAAAMGWLFLLHPRIGLVNKWLMQLFELSSAPLNIATVAGMGWVQGLNLAPVAFIMTAAVFRSLDPALEEAALVSRANMRQTLWAVTFRLAWPGVLAAAIYISTIGFAAFDVPAIIGWGNRIFTFSTYLVLRLTPAGGLPEYNAVAALSTVLIVLAALLSWWYNGMQRKAHRYQVVTGKGYRPAMVSLGRKSWLAWAFILLYVALSSALPLLVVLWASVLPYFQLPTPEAFASLTLDQYRSLPWDLIQDGVANSVILMAITPTVTLVLSVAFSWIVLKSRVPGRGSFDFIAFLPHAVPNIVFGVAALLLALFIVPKAVPLFGTLWVLVLVFAVARLSYGTRMTNGGLIQIHKELEEAAQISGANTASVVRRVLVPLLAPTLLYAWIWIALLTFRELTLAIILTSRENITVPVVVWSLWLNGGLAQASAFVVLMLLVMVPIIALYWILVRRANLVTIG